jgi:hypothetical protein
MIMIVLAAVVLLAGIPAFGGTGRRLEAKNREIAGLQEQAARLQADASIATSCPRRPLSARACLRPGDGAAA